MLNKKSDLCKHNSQLLDATPHMNTPKDLFYKAKQKAKILLLDLDGTLIGESGQLAEHLHDALHTLRERRPDLMLVICTGRPFGGIAKEIAERLGPTTCPHIFHGGALTRSLDRIHHAEAIAPELLLPLIELSTQLPHVSLELYSDDAIFVPEARPLDLAHADVLGMNHIITPLRPLLDQTPIIKAQWILHHSQIDMLRPTYPDTLAHAEATSDVMPDAAFVTVTRQGVDKGSATLRLLDELGLRPDEAIAIGDSSGDFPMLDAVGFPFLMQNAPALHHARYPMLPHIEKEGIIPLLRALAP